MLKLLNKACALGCRSGTRGWGVASQAGSESTTLTTHLASARLLLRLVLENPLN